MTDDDYWPATDAPGAPGISPTWCSSDKDMVGTSLGGSRIWFTLGFGIINEVYYPRVDIPQIRDLGLIIADDKGFWCEIKRLGNYQLSLPEPGIPAPTVVHSHERFELTLRVAADSCRDVVLIDVQLQGDTELKPYILLAPHLGGSGKNNTAAVGKHYSRKVLWAEQGPFGLALLAANRTQTDAIGRQSAGYVGSSDGWQDFSRNGTMSWEHARAGPGNVALLGELERDCVVALGFADSRGAAAALAIAALTQPFDQQWEEYKSAWKNWHAGCYSAQHTEPLEADAEAQMAMSRMVLHCHIDKVHPGGIVASLSVPWGNTRDDRAGYHLVWPRDLVQCATALLGAGDTAEARNVLRYLIATQHEDGHWNQNQWLGGTPFWQGVQLDETALPVVLAALLHEHDALASIEVKDMTRRALGFITRMGPVSDQDRWEEDRGINAFTLALIIAALVAGAPFLEPAEREAVLNLADDWNARIEDWLFVEQSELATRVGVRGHYMRVAPPEIITDREARHNVVPIKNRQQDPGLPADAQVSNDFLQLVRCGLRSPRDSRIRDSLMVSDKLLRVDTPSGPAWHRYNEDGYGEHADGAEYDGTGVGRAWPLLTGERGHYEILAGNDAAPYLQAMLKMAGTSGMLPEQVWDADAIPARKLYPGRPSGSAMPLAWTHAEFIKLLRSSQIGRPFDIPASVLRRYEDEAPKRKISVWSPKAPVRSLFKGTDLRLNLDAAAKIKWQSGSMSEWHEVDTQPALPGVHTAILPTHSLAEGDGVHVTFRPIDSSNASDTFHLEVVEFL